VFSSKLKTLLFAPNKIDKGNNDNLVFQKNKKTIILLCILLFIIFFCIYYYFSNTFADLSLFKEDNHFFQIDAHRVIGDISIFNANHYRTKVHPIYVLLINPLGLLINYWINNPTKVAILLNCVFGSIDVVLSYFFFINYSKKIYSSFLLALVFGFSSSQLFLSSVPDTSSIAICSLILTYLVFFLSLQKRKLSFLLWIFIGLFSFGVTITNFVQTFICFCIACYFAEKEKKKIRIFFKVIFYTASVVISAGLLSLLQKLIYPSSVYFFSKAMLEEREFA
jgi:hypothetical protein